MPKAEFKYEKAVRQTIDDLGMREASNEHISTWYWNGWRDRLMDHSFTRIDSISEAGRKAYESGQKDCEAHHGLRD